MDRWRTASLNHRATCFLVLLVCMCLCQPLEHLTLFPEKSVATVAPPTALLNSSTTSTRTPEGLLFTVQIHFMFYLLMLFFILTLPSSWFCQEDKSLWRYYESLLKETKMNMKGPKSELSQGEQRALLLTS